MSAGVAPWKALVRLAWRDTTRHKGRTALVIALIGVPVAMLLLGSVLIRTTVLSLDDMRAVSLGPVADLIVHEPSIDPPVGSAAGPPTVPPPSTEMPPLPQGARAVATTQASWSRFWATGHPKRPTSVASVSGDFTDPILAGQYLLRSGAWPTTNDGVAVTASLAKHARLKVGQSIELLNPKRTVTVTGVFEIREDLRTFMFASLAPINDSPTTFGVRQFWIDLGPKVNASEAKKVAEGLARQGWQPSNFDLFPGQFEVAPGTRIGGSRDSEATPIAIINVAGLILLFLLGTIVTAAFAVGARRQLRTLGLIAANGGEPRQLRRLVTLQGSVAAAVGALFGFALGAAALATVLPHLNRAGGKIYPGVDLVPLDIAIAFVMAVVAGSLAAAIPGRTIAKVPVLNALGGRRPMRNLSNALPVIGIVLAAIGVLLLAAATRPNSIGNGWLPAAAGAIAVLLGGVITAPWLVGRLAPLAGHLSGAPRLAIRRMTRHRGRSGPIVAAIMATGAVTVSVNTLVQSFQQGEKDRYIPAYASNQVNITLGGYGGPDQGATRARLDESMAAATKAVVEALPGSTVFSFATVTSLYGGPSSAGRYYRLAPLATGSQSSQFESFDPGVSIVIGSAEIIRALGVSQAVIDEFVAGKAIIGADSRVIGDQGGPTTIELLEQQVATGPLPAGTSDRPKDRTVQLQAIAIGRLDLGHRGQSSVCVNDACVRMRTTVVVVPASVAAANDLVGTPANLVIARAALTSEQRKVISDVREEVFDAADLAFGNRGFGPGTPQIAFENPNKFPVRIIELITGALALLLALAVTAVSLALTAVDNRPDDATLASLGAAPGIRRRLRAWEAWLLATSGMVLAVVFGFVPGIAIVQAQGKGDPLVFPWLTVLVLVVAVPLLAAAIGWLSARTPRRVDTSLVADA
jgi:putative ABC transport system permease protein